MQRGRVEYEEGWNGMEKLGHGSLQAGESLLPNPVHKPTGFLLAANRGVIKLQNRTLFTVPSSSELAWVCLQAAAGDLSVFQSR